MEDFVDDFAGAGSPEALLPEPKDMSHHYSDVTLARTPSAMKQYYKYFLIPGIANLAGGLPNPSFFPFDTLEAQAAKPERWQPSANRPLVETEAASNDDQGVSTKLNSTSFFSRASSSKAPQRAPETRPSHIIVPHDDINPDPFKKIDLATALQYGQANGYPPLLSFIRQFTRECLHPNVPYRGGPEVIFTVGSTDGMAKTLEMFTNVWVEGKHDIRDRPGLLTEVFMYPSVLSQSHPRGIQTIAVEMDDGGMLPHGPGSLEDVLENWDESKGKRPHLMYTVTMGHNPTSFVISLERRKQIYALCSKYDVIIIEDDPYWYLQFPSAEVEEAKARNLPMPEPKEANTLEKKSGYPFLDSLAPSYLNIDVDGRVVRLDTFSKTVAPGCRAGWITATPEIVDKFLRINESCTQQPSGFVQVFLAETLMGQQPETTMAAFAGARTPQEQTVFTGWKMDGWVRWLAGLRGQYERRMNRMCRILEDGAYQLKQSTPVRESEAEWGVITKTQLFDFAWPRGGMFLWLHMRFESHPLWKKVGTRGDLIDGPALSIALMVFLTHKPHLVLVSPGMMFSATPEVAEEKGWAYYRFCFAAEAEDKIDASTQRFVDGVQKFWRIKRPEELEDLLDEQSALQTAGSVEGMANLSSWMGC